MSKHKLDQVKMTPAYLEREWEITIQTPLGGLDLLLDAIGKTIPLRQRA